MRVATFNLHAGVDGWGRPTTAEQSVATFDADVIVLPELWRGDTGDDQFDRLRNALNMDGVFVPLARAHRLTTGSGGRTWQPRLAHLTGEYGLYFEEHRPLTRAQHLRRRAHDDVQSGDWGIALLTRCTIDALDVVPLGRLAREKVQRATIVGQLRYDGQPFQVIAVHGAHLSHGSYRQYRRIAALGDSQRDDRPTLMAGDFNSWRPLLRVLLPGWRSMVRARTWPARRPHSQIDHIFGRGPVRSLGGFAVDAGSDHRALVADVDWG